MHENREDEALEYEKKRFCQKRKQKLLHRLL